MQHCKKKTNSQPIKTLPFVYYYLPFFLIALVGLGSSIYLAASHYRVHTDPTYSSFCAVSRAFNCDTVSSSHFAVVLNVPLAIWGVIGYLLVLALLILAGRQQAPKKRLWPSLFWISIVYSTGSLILAGISTLLIHSYCLICILTYLVNFSLVYYAWFVDRRFENAGLFMGIVLDMKLLWSLRKVTIPSVAAILLLAGSLIAGMPPYWQMEPPPLSDSLPRGVTEEGHPWIGAENPTLTINEFSDYMCFQCKKMHFFLRELVRTHPNQIRLVHRHFPMDHDFNPLVTEPFHSGSGKMAILALYAQAKDQFWKLNDFLFNLAAQKKDFNTRSIAEQMGITSGELVAALNSRYLRLRLKHDIAMGIDFGLTGTPGFIIDDNVYTGNIPADILRKYIK